MDMTYVKIQNVSSNALFCTSNKILLQWITILIWWATQM